MLLLAIDLRGDRPNRTSECSLSLTLNALQCSSRAVGICGIDVRSQTIAIPRLKAAKDAARNDEQKKLIDRRVKLIEAESKSLEKVSEAYEAAINSNLQFRIYRQVGPHQVPLVQIGNN